MEEYQHGIYSSQHYPTSRKLARQSQQPYEEDDLDDTPLEEDPKVLPLPSKPRSQDSLAEDVILRSGKRKSSSSSQRKTKSTASKPKASKSVRSSSSANPQLFVDELQKLEARADRINQILAERARKKDGEPSPTGHSMPISGQALYSQQYQEVSLPPSHEWPAPVSPESTETEKSVSQPWSPQFWEQRMDAGQQQQARQDAWQTAANLRYLNHPGQPSYGDEGLSGLEDQRPAFRHKTTTGTSSRSPSFPWHHLGWQRFLEIPHKPIERISDGVVWIGVGAIVRMLSRFVLMAFPGLTPVFTLLMLTPAMLAVFLALFVPRMGWVPCYRLFLITLGLLIGGKF